ncbi:LacI family DNA-binding transcriptional regulator [Paenibacillus arenilitoris]|uniref:LacI family DNA-binding transcriptional regulator n=1 Tax=Paenibacillus arenilitoris TaxID=2772299 RepID=A0A927CH37_9BACL|nr:LacI family DNA-binding transcriptional regulator [Paenibacillus arenilitoris]MBD2867384.1 LacI family DNA-binding transcriptional regulator [Paenibacillus arenilitoris]
MLKATIKEVAAEAEVSTATVSRVLNNSLKVSEEARRRVNAAIAKLNYEPSAIARSLKQDRTFMIGVIVPDITNPYFMEISKGIEDTVGQSGFQLMFCSSDENTDKESRLLQLLNEKRVDAVVVATAGGNGSKIAGMSRSGLPVVLIDRTLENVDGLSELDLIAEDNAAGAYMLAKRLLEDGHTAIGVVNGPSWVSTGRERYEGVLRALNEFGIEQPPLVYNGDFTVEGGVRAVRRFWQSNRKPTAIVSLNNRMTFGVLLELIRKGQHIPTDVAIASFGEVEAGQLLKNPKLYYIDQQPYDMGKRTGELLLSRMDKQNQNADPHLEIFSHQIKCIP